MVFRQGQFNGFGEVRFVVGESEGIGMSGGDGSKPRSPAVKMPTTPGIDSTSSDSIATISPCAIIRPFRNTSASLPTARSYQDYLQLVPGVQDTLGSTDNPASRSGINYRDADREGGDVGPDLSGVALKGFDRDWHIRHLRDPVAVVEGSQMMSFGHLRDDEIDDVLTYLDAGRIAEDPLAVGFDGRGQTCPDAVPAGQDMATLRPGEHPRDCPQVLQRAGAEAPRGPRADIE